jgi:hypothetical protein
MAECPEDPKIDPEIAFIKEVMLDLEVDPNEIPEEKPFNLKKLFRNLKSKKWSRRYSKCRAYGHFKCHDEPCAKAWKSSRAWCILNLKMQRVEIKLKQVCSQYKKHSNFKGLRLSENKNESNGDKSSVSEIDISKGVFPIKICRHGKCALHAVNRYLVLVGRKERQKKYADRQRQAKRPHCREFCHNMACILKGSPC